MIFIDWKKSISTASSTATTNANSARKCMVEDDNNGHSISTWRSVLIANKWNKMQVMRKKYVEFTLLCVIFFLNVLKLNNDSMSQPKLNNLIKK